MRARLRALARPAALGAIAVALFLLLRPGGPGVGAPAPDFTARTLAGPDFQMSQQRGRVVLLDFWATWCPPCRKSLPALQKLHRRYEGTDVSIVTVNVDDGPDREDLVRRYLAASKLDFPVILGTNGLVQRYGVTRFPTTIVVDGEGRVRHVETGIGGRDAAQIEAHLAGLLEAARAPL